MKKLLFILFLLPLLAIGQQSGKFRRVQITEKLAIGGTTFATGFDLSVYADMLINGVIQAHDGFNYSTLGFNPNGGSVVVGSAVQSANFLIYGTGTGTNFISNVAAGTQPYAATSPTLNVNLNADLWDSYSKNSTTGFFPFDNGTNYVNSPLSVTADSISSSGMFSFTGGKVTTTGHATRYLQFPNELNVGSGIGVRHTAGESILQFGNNLADYYTGNIVQAKAGAMIRIDTRNVTPALGTKNYSLFQIQTRVAGAAYTAYTVPFQFAAAPNGSMIMNSSGELSLDHHLTVDDTATANSFVTNNAYQFDYSGSNKGSLAYVFFDGMYSFNSHTGDIVLSTQAGDVRLAAMNGNKIAFSTGSGLLNDVDRLTIENSDITATVQMTAPNFISNVAEGTQPYAATSATLNTNLNADLLDGQHGSYYATASGFVPYTGATTNVDLGSNSLTAASVVSTSKLLTNPSNSVDNSYYDAKLASSSTNRILFGIQGTGNQLIGSSSANDGVVSMVGANDLHLGTNFTKAITIDGTTQDVAIPNGHLGIGAAADAFSMFLLEKASSVYMRLNNTATNGDDWTISNEVISTESVMRFIDQDTGIEPLRLNQSGDVSIPSGDLDVTNDITKEGTSVINTAELQNSLAGQSYSFDWTNDYIDLGDDTDLDITDNLSISARFKYNDKSTTQFVAGRDDGTNRNYWIEIQAGGLVSFVTIGLSTLTTVTTNPLTEGVWYDIVGTYDGSNTKIYVNGALDVTTANTGTIDNDDVSFTIGAREGGLDRYFSGEISEAKIYNRALTAAEVKNLSQGEPVSFADKGASQTDILSGWDLNNWIAVGGGTIDDANSFTTVSNGGVNKILLTVGKTYVLNFSLSTTASTCKIHNSTGSAVDEVFSGVPFNAVDTHLYIRNTGAGVTDITLMELSQVGNVLDLNNQGITTSTWYDNSGNGLDGTVTGATPLRQEDAGFNNIVADGSVTAASGVFGGATISTSAASGLNLFPTTGSTTDFKIHNGLGQGVISNATGTKDLEFSGDVSIPNGGLTVNENVTAPNIKETIILACSDELSTLTAGTSKLTFRIPYNMTLTEVRASVTTAPTGLLTVDINEDGTTILSTKLTIDSGEKKSTTAATAVVISDSALADFAEITIDLDGTTGGTGLKIYLIGTI